MEVSGGGCDFVNPQLWGRGGRSVGDDSVRKSVGCRLQSRGLESLTAGLQSLRLASRLKPWLRTVDGLGWLMAASHGLRVQTRKLTPAN